MSFTENSLVGKVGETDVARWLMSRGCRILPVYEIAENQHKGPVFYANRIRQLVAPDMFVFGTEKIFWAEVKTKSAFSLHRISDLFVTGIDLHHYEDYLAIEKETGVPIWLFFYHADGAAKDSPPGPSGLFGRSLQYLKDHENHRHENHGRHGMVYWARESLMKYADYPLEIGQKDAA